MHSSENSPLIATKDEAVPSSTRTCSSFTRKSVTFSNDSSDSNITSVPPPPPVTPLGKVSSLDFERIVNQYSIQAMRDQWSLPSQGSSDDERMNATSEPRDPRILERHLLGYTGRTASRWFLTILAGLLTGLTSIFIVEITGIIIAWRGKNLHRLIVEPSFNDDFVFFVYASINLMAALASCSLCCYWVPQASGSGIGQVKAYLNGIRGSQRFTRLPLFFVKVVGTILSVGSGLATGAEGPLVHIGAMMGSGCSKISGLASKYVQSVDECAPKSCICRSSGRRDDRATWTRQALNWMATELSHFGTDAERHDLVSIGASCGFAASFGAPIGGLLFILDDVASFFSKNLLMRMLVANAIGTFCLAVLYGDLSDYSVINLGTYTEVTDSVFVDRVEELPLYVLIGIAGGAMGGVFCKLFKMWRKSFASSLPASRNKRAQWQMLEVACVSVVTSVLLFYLPTCKWACKERVSTTAGAHLDLNFNDAHHTGRSDTPRRSNQFFCPEGEVNEPANMIFGSRIAAIKRILTEPQQFQQKTLVTVGGLFYFLMLLTCGTAIPCGIFTPTVLIGASLGGAAGVVFQSFDEEVSPSTFALLGVASLLAGIQRSTVSVVVILVEGTGQIKIMLPAIITVVVSRYVARMLHRKGIHEIVMSLNKLPYLDHGNKRWYDAIEVRDIMSEPPLETLTTSVQAKALVELLSKSHHNGFPVVEPTTKKFLGLVRRDQIAALLECGVFRKSSLEVIPSPTRTEYTAAPLMRWAFHINDDRYDYVLSEPTPAVMARKAAQHSPEPAPKEALISSPDLQTLLFSPLPVEFAAVDQNEEGLIYVSWLNPAYENYWVNIGSVMNRGAYCVTEFCPVSKAYKLFTSLGLRHVTVLGGKSGGEVVGVLTRENLLPDHITRATGV